MPRVWGREGELARVMAAVRAQGAATAVLSAPPGTGKTTLVNEVVRLAADAGLRVLRTAPLQAEEDLPLIAIGNLLAGVDESAYDALPPPQRRAIRAALLLDDGGETDPRALAAAFRGVLHGLTGQGRLLLVIDDAQWLDSSSLRLLQSALGRLDADVCLLVSTRPVLEDRRLALGAGQVLEERLSDLAPDAIFHMVQDQLNVTLDRGDLRDVARKSGGNPLCALTLVRTRATGDGHVDDTLDLVVVQVGALPPDTRRALLYAALEPRASVDVMAEVAGLGPEEFGAALEPARAAGLVTAREGRVHFSHPLHLQAAIDAALAPEVRAAHAGWVEHAEDEVARLVHRGHAAPGAVPGLDADLEAAARSLRSRGAIDGALDLMELAIARTPAGSNELAGRQLLLGTWLHTAGRPGPAEHWLRAARDASGTVGHAATLKLCENLIYRGRRDEARPMIHELLDADLPPLMACDVRFRVGRDAIDQDLPAEAALLAAVNRTLAEIPDEPGRDALRVEAFTEEARIRTNMGEPASHLVEQALELERSQPPALVMRSATAYATHLTALGGHHDSARIGFEKLLTRCADEGDEFSLGITLFQYGLSELRAGRLDHAAELAHRGTSLSAGQGQFYAVLHQLLAAYAEIQRSDAPAAIAWLEAECENPSAPDEAPYKGICHFILGAAMRVRGRPTEGLAHLERAHELIAAAGWRDPANADYDQDLIEALADAGRLDEAAAHLARVREVAERMGNRQAILQAMGVAAVQLLAARGDLDGAVAEVPAMLAAFGPEPERRIAWGRALLTAGQVLRRARRRSAAGDYLSRAICVFEEAGTAPYAALARTELARVGLRRRTQDTELTATERQVAELAAAGLRNNEIAERLFLSPRTVEGVLARCYRKLGIRGRSQLGRALGERIAH